MAVLIALELFTLWFSIQSLSSVRALVGAEGLYSKSQKDATFYLQKYNYSHNEADYQAFVRFMKVPLGDHKARVELMKENPDFDKAKQGFIAARIHEKDIDGMMKLFRRFHNNSYIKNAIAAWTKGDSLISMLIPIGETIHNEILSGKPSSVKLQETIKTIDILNEQLTQVEDEFSYVLGEGSRWLTNLVLTLLFAVAIIVEVTGLGMTIIVSHGITKGLNEINRASRKISNGDLNERATIYSNDEIGQVAGAINQMTEQLVLTNNELRQFAYIASHDLQEPLKTLSNYVGLFQLEYEGKLKGDADIYMSAILRATSRMKLLIKDILDYSHIGMNRKILKTDCNILLQDVLNDLAVSIEESKAIIEYKKLPTIYAHPELAYLFQNIISNAVKFRKANEQPIIRISSQEKNDEWFFAIADNGIGIDEIYHDRIFTIFQKLHSKKAFSGSGIGLAHCKKIVELHGGKIWVESEIHKGSTFNFYIPKIISA
jgi:signal transduction histidine kinase